MRGASALGAVLDKLPAARIRVFVIWEPVISTDVHPPTAEVRAPVADPRVTEYWDEGLWMSPRFVERARLTAEAAGTTPVIAAGEIAWDFVARFPPGVRWEEPFPVWDYYDRPVENVIGAVEAQVAAQVAGGGQ